MKQGNTEEDTDKADNDEVTFDNMAIIRIVLSASLHDS